MELSKKPPFPFNERCPYFVSQFWADARLLKGRPTRMPSLAEAELLSEVRLSMASLMGFKAQYLTADDVIFRYAELMSEAADKAKAKRKLRRAA